MISEEKLNALMAAAIDGDSSAYNSFLREVSARLRAFYRRKFAMFGRSDLEAEDLVQETLIAIHSRRHTYDTALPIMPWVFAIARYKLIDHLRSSKAAIEVALDEADDLTTRSEQDSVEARIDLGAAMATLPESMQEAIRMTKLDGLSIAEASHHSGRSESSLKVGVHRGLKAIGKLLKI